MADIQMPQLGETVTEGTITKWFKSVGDQVAEDEPLFEVSTDKVDSEVPSPVSGTLTEILVEEGDTVDVGAVLARVGDAPAESAPAGGRAAAAEDTAAEDTATEETAATEQPAGGRAATAEEAVGGEGGTARDGQDRAGAAAAGSLAPPAEAAPEGPAQPATPAPAAEQPAPGPGQAPAPAPTSPPTSGADGDGLLLSPVVRRLVSENGLDPATIPGTGPGGRLTRNDVLAVLDKAGGAAPAPGATPATAAPPAPAAPAVAARPAAAPAPPAPRPATAAPRPAVRPGERDTVVPHTNMRRRTAEHMARSKATSAHVYASIEVDFENVERVRRAEREAFRAAEGFSLTYLPFVARAVIDAIHSYPSVNASFGEDELVVHNYVDLGIAVDLDFEGLMVPVVHDADGKRLRAIAREVSDLARRARSRQLGPDDIAGGTFTITNPGPFGTTMTLPIINQPQVAIVSTDGVRRRPVAVDLPDGSEGIAIHSVGNITLTWDHRAFDGAYAAAFLREVQEVLETRDWVAELA
ncbi:MAG TPA: dihydrolipoamide acetyltransferase family protein [Acidimicrobiales bacterium]|nr:dihydrolipoamide acetyltransferase family protein [Acidimicrobiales bacterium]